ncbi:MAG: hypothetical protein ACK5TR_04655 [Alphaproteobacteria bacterium]|jgi:hypothetical protein|nr:hypothetical protein [Alphaproteobacteria bacterium]
MDGEDLEITRQQNKVARYFDKNPEILKAQLASYDNQGDVHQFLYVISKRLIDQERYQDALSIALQARREYLTPEMQDNFDFNKVTLYTASDTARLQGSRPLRPFKKRGVF